MSKIQDAIRKVRAAHPHREPEPVHGGAAIASVELEESGLHTGPLANRIVRRIHVDLARLKAQGFLPPEDQQRRLADQFRRIKRPLLDNAAGRTAHRESASNLILVGSALPGDGKTFNCINLALSIAVEKDVSVVLVDGDVAKPHISSLFGLRKEPGLIDLLSDDSLQLAELILPTDIPNLSILPAGRMSEHAPELLASRSMEAVARVLGNAGPGRIVIFDSSPLLASSEAMILARLVGQIVIIVGAGHTPREAVLEALEALDEAKAINLILNRAASGSGAESYGYYGYGYEQGGAALKA